MRCAQCNADLRFVMLDMFKRDGTDEMVPSSFYEEMGDSVLVPLPGSWTGMDLTAEEQRERIVCPNCNKYPFAGKRISIETSFFAVCSNVDGDDGQDLIDEEEEPNE